MNVAMKEAMIGCFLKQCVHGTVGTRTSLIPINNTQDFEAKTTALDSTVGCYEYTGFERQMSCRQQF